MSIYAIPPLLGTLAFASLGLFVFLHPPHTKEKRIFSLLFIETFIWQIIWFISFFTKTSAHIDFLAKFAYLGITFIPFTFYHFIAEILKAKKEINLVRFFYILAVFLVAIIFPTNLFVAGHRSFSWGNFAAAGPLYPIFMISAFVAMLRGCYVLIKAKRHPENYPISRNHVHYLLLGLFAYFLCTLDFPQVFGFKIYPVGTLFFLLSFSIIAYAITRHQLLDIEVIIKKTLVLAGLLVMVMGVVNIITSIVQNSLGKVLPVTPGLSMVISGFIIILLHDPVKKWLVHITDRFLFQKKEEFRVVLNRLAENIITILDLDKVGQIILSTLRESLRLESGAIILKDESDKGYYVLDSFNIQTGRAYYELDSFLVKYVSGSKSAISLEDPAIRGKIPTVVLARLMELCAMICIPLFIHNDLIGILTLGKKKSDEEFTQNEIGHFPTLAGQVAIALSNARNADIIRKNQIVLLQHAKMAALGTFSAGFNHDIRNPLNGMKGMIEMHQMNWEDGLFKNHSKDDYHEEVNKMLNSVVEDIDTITGKIKGLLEFVRKGEVEFKSEPVDLEKEVDSAYRILRSQMQHDVIDFIKEVPADLPKVLGDATRINEILVNIINNARQAIKHNGTIKVVAKKNRNIIELNIIDDGPGMSGEIQQQIFDPFFTTKQEGEGTGMGLHTARGALKQMNAKISVKSEVGKGSTFSIEFNIASIQQ